MTLAVLNSSAPHSRPDAPHAQLLRHLMNPLPDFLLINQCDPVRPGAEQFVADRYRSSYGAQVTHFFPALMTLSCHGHLSAAAGLHPATPCPLYLERYLSAPVEQVLSEANHNAQVKRGSVVEVGNLAASRRGTSHLLFLMFTLVLHEAGYEWIVFTATRALRNNLQKLDYPCMKLQSVDVSALPQAQLAEWGSYYATEPAVMAGRLEDAAKLIASNRLYRHIAKLYRPVIVDLARQMRQMRQGGE